MKKMLAVSLVFSLAAAVYADVNFDQGVNTSEIINAPHNDYYIPTPVPGRFGRYTRDCARFTFGPSDNDIMSEKVWLRSQEYVQECHTYYVPGPNGQQIPHQNCYERPGMSWNQQAQINIKARKLWPWERETFEVCLEGPWMDIYKYEAAYKYTTRKIGNYDPMFELTPQYKVAMNPDLAGLEIGSFSYDKNAKKYTFKVNDKWAKEYAGEKVSIKVELKKSVSNWFDSSKGEKEFTFDAANSYEMVFGEEDLVKPQANSDDTYRSEKLFDTKGMYLKWGFKRLGKISTDKYMDKGDTQVIQTK